MNGLLSQQAQGLAMVYRMVQRQASLLALQRYLSNAGVGGGDLRAGFLLLKRARGGGSAAH